MLQSPIPELVMSRPQATLPWVIWGGLMPSGSLKHLTFQSYLSSLGGQTLGPGIIEISEGCTALALQYFAERAGIPLTVLCSPAGRAVLTARGCRAELIAVHSLEQALRTCSARQKEGWLWPEQMTNPRLVEAVQTWAPAVASLLRRHSEIDTVACGFGTGATLAGLKRALSPLGYRVIGLQAPPAAPIAGWRNFATQNLGARDLFHVDGGETELQTATLASPTPVAPLEVLLTHDYGVDPTRLCVVSHDGVPAPGMSRVE